MMQSPLADTPEFPESLLYGDTPKREPAKPHRDSESQLRLDVAESRDPADNETANSNTLQSQDSPVHGWYRFVQSYPPHLVRKYAEKFKLNGSSVIFDPFCGTGTTLVEAKLLGINSIGCDAHPFAVLASRVKTNWSMNVAALEAIFAKIIEKTIDPPLKLDANGSESVANVAQEIGLSGEQLKLIPEGFVSPQPLRRLLLLRQSIDRWTRSYPRAYKDFFYIALAHVIANGAGNFGFGPEIYRTKAKSDYAVMRHFRSQIELMIDQLAQLQFAGMRGTRSVVKRADARSLKSISGGISAVITSPPYPNEKDYTRTTRVESLLLGLLSDKKGLRKVKENLLRSNTRNVFIKDSDSAEVSEFSSIRGVCDAIEARRIALKKTSGFERLYHKVVAHYFGGMRKHFRSLLPKLAKNAQLAYVVGDQLSFLMVPVPTAQLLGEVAAAEGFEVTGCDLWRERVGTKIRNDVEGRKTVRVREEVLLLKRP